MSDVAPLLRFDAVRFDYGRGPVFDRLSLEVARGEMTAVLGPNGSGKTTLLRLAAGWLTPVSGAVSIEGTEVGSIPPAERARRVAVVPQETHPAFDFSVEEIVLLGRAPHLGLLGLDTPGDRAIAREAMERAGVAAFAGRPFRRLSGGERQRVTLARALAQGPEILLLDEPTAFLDLKHRLRVHEMLVELNADKGVTVVLAGHDVNLAARHCGRLVLLGGGRVVADGPPAEVLRPEPLLEVYGVDVEVREDPGTGRPWVVPLRPADDSRPV